MIQESHDGFEICCDWGRCLTHRVTGYSAQEVTDRANEAGWEMQIKRAMNGKQHVFYFCPVHAARGREFDTEGKSIKPPKLKFQEK